MNLRTRAAAVLTVAVGSAATALTATVAAAVAPAVAAIHDIQGAAHRSPLTARTVLTTGVVSVIGPHGCWITDPRPEDNPATSEGQYVFTGTAPGAAADPVRVPFSG